MALHNRLLNTWKPVSRQRLAEFAMGAAVGSVFFLLVYGASTLNVTYDSWIYAGYMEWDIVQSYAGWMYYRQADWSWPITVAQNLAQPIGVATTFTDSVPLLTVFLKVLSPILPPTFQYFGWYNFFSCALQGGFSFVLLHQLGTGRIYAGVGSLLFTSYPIMVERLFRHSALGSQWLLLAAFVCYVNAKRGQFPYLGYLLLCVLAPGITFYFTPMVYAILLASLLNGWRRNKDWKQPIAYMAVCFMCTLGTMYVLGILTRGGGGVASGYGEYSMNLNAPFNPTSFNDYADGQTLVWSRVLPVLPQRHRQYDGFNYMGLGVLAGLALMLAYHIIHLVRGGKPARAAALALLRRHVFLVAVVAIMALFAPSNVLTFNDTVLFTVPLPGFILRLCSIFRASGRFFWPLSYLLLLWLLVFIHQRLQGRGRLVAVALLALVQLFDLSGTLVEKHSYFGENIVAGNEFETADWQYFAANYDAVVCLGPIFDYDMAAGFIRYNPDVQTNILLANRGNFDGVYAGYEPAMELLRSGERLPDNTLYLCTDDHTLAYVMEGIHEDARAYRTGHFRIIANPWPDCPVEPYEVPEL